nr:hypothetical protein [Trichormus sp. NMC-1]
MALSKLFPLDLCSTKITPFQSKSIKPCLLSAFLTDCSNVATRRREIPKTLKKPSQNDFPSASSEVSYSHSWEKAIARLLISFQLNGIADYFEVKKSGFQ